MQQKEFKQNNSLSQQTRDRLDTGADWRVLALSQANHRSRLSKRLEEKKRAKKYCDGAALLAARPRRGTLAPATRRIIKRISRALPLTTMLNGDWARGLVARAATDTRRDIGRGRPHTCTGSCAPDAVAARHESHCAMGRGDHGGRSRARESGGAQPNLALVQPGFVVIRVAVRVLVVAFASRYRCRAADRA